ncbi:MAG: gliding motility protein, partial [Flavobacteriales bacterium]|nr:gliding motility protein [Flavobacteriales bacterium]
PKNNNVSYKITPVGNPELVAYSGVVSNANPVQQPVLDLDGNIDSDNNSQLHVPNFELGAIFTNRGFIIEAEDVVYVSVRVRSSIVENPPGFFNKYHASALVSKGSSALGTQFRIGGFIRDAISLGDLTFASMMATEDNTNITIQLNGRTPINITLNEHESYITHTSGASAIDIIGGLISSNKPIVVNSGSATGSFGDRPGNADYGFDQIVDASRIGREYIVVKGNGTGVLGSVVEKVLIIAHEDNTEFSINGISVGTLNAGRYAVVPESSYSSNGNMYIYTTKPVFIFQGVGGSPSQANQYMFFVPPLSCENTGNVDNIAFINQVDNSDESFEGGITIVTNIEANVTINGN